MGFFGSPNIDNIDVESATKKQVDEKPKEEIKSEKSLNSENSKNCSQTNSVDSSYKNIGAPGEFRDHSSTSSVNNSDKDKNKLVFKITRKNKITMQEKVITKNRRIINQCQHTSSKYYAKGMCKK